MVRIWVHGDSGEVAGVVEQANGLQGAYQFSSQPAEGAVPLRVVCQERAAPYAASREGGVVISTWQSEPISHYAGIDQRDYIATVAMLGVA